MSMIAKVRTEYRAPITHAHPWVCERYIPEEDGYRVISDHKTESAANATARRVLAELPASEQGNIHVRERRTHGGGWMVMVSFIDGIGYGYGGPDQNKPMSEEDANAAAERDRARIGVVDQHMMASSAYGVIVLRRCEGDRWTVGIGVGSHTKHLPGSYETPAEAEAIGRKAVEEAWDVGLARWRKLAEEACISCRVEAQRPKVMVLMPAKGESAWDALAVAQKAQVS